MNVRASPPYLTFLSGSTYSNGYTNGEALPCVAIGTNPNTHVLYTNIGIGGANTTFVSYPTATNVYPINGIYDCFTILNWTSVYNATLNMQIYPANNYSSPYLNATTTSTDASPLINMNNLYNSAGFIYFALMTSDQYGSYSGRLYNFSVFNSVLSQADIQTLVSSSNTPPSPPTNLAVQSSTNTSITISFTPPTSAPSYYTVCMSPFVNMQTFTGSPYTITGLTANTTYTITLSATGSIGGMSSSISVNGTTAP
jgi:hypothetical protein